VAAVLIALAGFALGAGIVAVQLTAHGPVRIDREVSGEVTLVNVDGTSVCLAEDGGGAQFCSDIVKRPEFPALAVGQRITGTVLWSPVAAGSGQLLLVTSIIQ
jgi:hypothetical protein